MGIADGACVIIDNGTYSCKAGLTGHDTPSVHYRSCVERSKLTGQEDDSSSDVIYPINSGIISDWDGMEYIWQNIFMEKLKIQPDEKAVLLTEVSMNPKTFREKMSEIMFERFSIPHLYIAKQPQLAMYATGRVTGVVLDIGEDVSRSVPIYEGNPVLSAIQETKVSGRMVTENLKQLLNILTDDRAPVDSNSLQDIKETLCYVALDFEKENERSKNCSDDMERSYLLPDGKPINIVRERFHSTEILFNPESFGKNEVALNQLILSSVMRVDTEIQKDVFGTVVLAGGSTMFHGLEDRLKKELMSHNPPSTDTKIVAPKDRNYVSWIGGSIFSSFSDVKTWLPKNVFEEHGPQSIHRFCP